MLELPWAEQRLQFRFKIRVRRDCTTDKEIDVQESPYAEWLEDSIRTIVNMRPDTMALIAIRNEDETCLTAYYNADAHDMGRFITNIASDFIMEVIEANAEDIHDIINGEGE